MLAGRGICGRKSQAILPLSGVSLDREKIVQAFAVDPIDHVSMIIAVVLKCHSNSDERLYVTYSKDCKQYQIYEPALRQVSPFRPTSKKCANYS